MKKNAFVLFFGSFALASTIANAYNDSPSCYKELQTHFFRQDLVLQALSMHFIGQSQWTPINNALQEATKAVPQMVKEQAVRMPRNPLENPFQAKEAEELLRKILFEVFEAVLHQYGVTNPGDIREMFEYIEQQQAGRIKSCFRK